MSKDYFLKKPLLNRIPEPERTEVIKLLSEVYEAGKRDLYATILETLPEEDFELLQQKIDEEEGTL
jgi:hypothetical protein